MAKNTNEGKLHINQLAPNARLSILAINGRKTVELSINRARLNPDEASELDQRVEGVYIPLEVVTQEYQKKVAVISFQNVKADMYLLAIQGPDIYKWSDISVAMLYLADGKRVHVLKLPDPLGSKFNRRKGIRINLDIRMNVQQNHGKTSVIVRDISYCGCKIEELNKSYIDPSQPFILELVDPNNTGEKVIEYVQAKVVRQEKKENGNVVSGCKVHQDFHGALQKYIAVKQLERVRGKKNPNDLIHAENHEHWKNSIVYELNNAQKKSKPKGQDKQGN